MTILKTAVGRRSFLKASVAASGGLTIGFSLFAAPQTLAANAKTAPDHWFEMNAFLSINPDGSIKVKVQNPEFGQGLMTSFPMIAAEELDAAWDDIQTEMAPFALQNYNWQFSGGSRSINRNFDTLRMAGASARHMLRSAAAQQWGVPLTEVNTSNSQLTHANGKKATYGEMAAAAALQAVPKEVPFKDSKQYSIIGSSRKNLQGKDIVTGHGLFGIDQRVDGMLYAAIVHPPAFGLTLESFDADSIKGLPGVRDVFAIKTYLDGYLQNYFDTNAFTEMVAIVGDSTWQLLKAKKQLKATWKQMPDREEDYRTFTSKAKRFIPGALESTDKHNAAMDALLDGEIKVDRRDGNPEEAFANAATILERRYHGPYLAHNTMEPMNFFADVKADSAYLSGPHQGPMFVHDTVAQRLGLPKEKITFDMTRMGGGFGRRAYPHFAVEAAVISKHVGKPVLLTYSREDDMTMGIYRPSYRVKLRAALDANNNLIAYHVKSAGVPEACTFANRFPAGAVDNYLAEGAAVDSNITTGAFRAPRSNFMAAAEQSFLDELAEVMGKDPIDLRLELLAKAKANPVGEKNDYDADRYMGVLKLAREKSGWDNSNKKLGVAAYFCHASYAATVIDLDVVDGKPVFNKVTSAVDCGTLVNHDAAVNMAQGGIIDAIGNALFGEMTFVDGVPQKQNLDSYRMIRMSEAPKSIDVHFVESNVYPTGLGEPPFPPTFAAVANALHGATGKRFYNMPFVNQLKG